MGLRAAIALNAFGCDAAVVDALRITRKFIGMLRERGVKKLDGWVEDAEPKPYDEVWA